MIRCYGLDWDEATWPRIEIEKKFIQNGGYLTINRNRYGEGLSFHYEAMRKLLWPRLDDHRWHRLCRDEILKNKVTVLMGPASSGKTHEAAWIYLIEYFCFPEETCVLVSSTDIRGLRLRVWGEIAMLWQEALDVCPTLPGHLLESRLAITTDALTDGDYNTRTVRDMRKSIAGIPTVQGGKYIGLGKWAGVKQKRMRLIADEACFPAGTLVETPSGRRTIETIRPGDYVLNAAGKCRVKKVMQKWSGRIMKIRCSDGRSVVCTHQHPFLTQKGWICACNLNQTHYMVGRYEAMQILRERNVKQNLLLSVLLCELDYKISGREKNVLHEIPSEEDWASQFQAIERKAGTRRGVCEKECTESIHEQSREPEKTFRNIEAYWSQTKGEGWKWDRTNQGREVLIGNVSSTLQAQLCDQNRKTWRQRIPDQLQGGYCFSGMASCNRSRWVVAQVEREKRTRLEEIQSADGSWVDGVEILEPEDFGGYSEREGGIEVYNLEVATHPSFCVNGFVVHNSMMGSSFLSAFANLNKNEDFRAIIIGNPNDPLDPLGKAAEPLDGWTNHLQPAKTEVWKTRFMNGTCVNLIGTDSPNFDFPVTQPPRYKYLISQQKIDETLSFFPKDSSEYYSQCVGCMKVGTLDDRIVTRDLCRNHHALEDVIWHQGDIVKVCALDAAYGGDRAVCGHIEFGEMVGGRVILAFNPPQVVPVVISDTSTPEEQLAIWVKDYCERNGIPPEHFYHDSTGRGGLGTAIARVFSAECNPVEFGGAATDRPVAIGLYTWDMETQTRRLTKCKEHYDRLVSELWYQFRYAIESEQVRRLPEDVMDELSMRKWHRKNNKISIEKKEEMKERIGRSPDLGDWAALCLEGARRLGFVIEKVPGDGAERAGEPDYLEKELDRYHREKRKRQLSYT